MADPTATAAPPEWLRCRCREFLSTPCTARATAEDRLCDNCRKVEQREGPNRHEGNSGWEHMH